MIGHPLLKLLVAETAGFVAWGGFAECLPVPDHVRITACSPTSLSLKADVVEGAKGYCFDVRRLLPTPGTTNLESFAAAPALSAEGWTLAASSNTVLSSYASSTYCDMTTPDRSALRISPKSEGKQAGDIQVEVTAPVCPAAVTEIGFLAYVGSVGKSDRFLVHARPTDSSEWEQVGELVPQSVGKTNFVVRVAEAADYRQVKFELLGSASNFSIAAWDSLRVVYGADETAAPVTADDIVSEPELALSDLVPGRYAFRLRAVGGEVTQDSPWSEEQRLDLGWSGPSVQATDAETLSARWSSAAYATGYRVDLMSVVRATVRESDFSSLPAAWPEGWTAHPEWKLGDNGDFYRNNGVLSLKFVFDGAWVSPAALDAAATLIEFSARSLSPSAEVLAAQRLVVEGRESATDAWRELASVRPMTTNTTWRVAVTGEVRQLQFVAYSDVGRVSPNIVMDGFRVTMGSEVTEVVRTETTTATTATFDGLSSEGCYRVSVTALQGDKTGLTLESELVEMAQAKPRPVGCVAFSSIRETGFIEDFTALANIASSPVDLGTVAALANWQLLVGDEIPRKMSYTSTCKDSAAGVFVVSDTDRTAASYLLATHATGNNAVMMGVAFTNDTIFTVSNIRLSFDAVQRSFQEKSKSQIVEWLVTDGTAAIDTTGDWHALTLGGETAPDTSTTVAEGTTASSRRFADVSLAKAKVPAGAVLILRWRDPVRASSPMMGVDNIRLDFTLRPAFGLRFIVR